LNRFRGDASLLAPGPEQLRAMTGVSTLAVVPMVRGHGLPEEDGVPDPTPTPLAAFAQNLKYSANAFADLRGPGQVVVLATPHASNLDEFEPLRAAGVPCTFSADANALVKARLLILPGSKNTRADLEWLRAQQLDRMIYAHVNANKPLLAICGGLQLTGEWIKDEQGVEGGTIGGDAGLGLLPLVTVFERDKHLSRTHARFEKLAAPWDVWSDQRAHGYEIRHGRTAALGQARPALTNVQPVEDDATLGWQSGPVLAVYLHGLFENPNLIRTMLGLEPPGLDDVFERLADTLDASFEPGTLERLVNDRRSRPR
ncbi:MAG TPA: cobyric acid synthase CobQ, partial [Burkholderiaceae bacterium]|nr:cobyric acid synthase CobQ [Burkholderiaceae bacterium]